MAIAFWKTGVNPITMIKEESENQTLARLLKAERDKINNKVKNYLERDGTKKNTKQTITK